MPTALPDAPTSSTFTHQTATADVSGNTSRVGTAKRTAKRQLLKQRSTETIDLPVSEMTQNRAKLLAHKSTKISLPKQLGPYRILGRLGRGGMNYVMRAQHTTLKRIVALKVLPPHHVAQPENLLASNKKPNSPQPWSTQRLTNATTSVNRRAGSTSRFN